MNSNFTGFSIIPDDKLSETDKQIQLALGFGLGKRAFYNGEEHYYLNDNEIVKFDRYDQTFRNTKFLIKFFTFFQRAKNCWIISITL